MAKLADLIKASAADRGASLEAWIKMAYILRIDPAHARHLLRKYGNGYVYSKTGMAMPIKDGVAERMAETFGGACVVTDDGVVYGVSKHDIKRKHKREHDIKRNIARHKAIKEHKEAAAIREEHKRQHVFTSMQGRPCPKKQGKGDGLGDLGKYVNERAMRLSEVKPEILTRKYRRA